VGIALLAGLAGICPDLARADGRLAVGLCVPEIPFTGALARHRAAKRVAQHLSRALRRPVEGLAYLNPEDLLRAVHAGTLQFAVVGALFAASVPDEQILAQGRVDSEAASVWSVLCRDRRDLRDLQSCKGKRLQIPKMGPETLKLVQEGILGGKLDVKKHFKVQWSPNLLSAEMAVVLGQADAVVAPLSAPGLVPLVRGYALPPPAFVLVNRQLPRKTVEVARGAILSLTAPIGSVGGWEPPDVAAYHKLTAFATKQGLKMSLVPVNDLPLDLGDLLQQDVLLPAMPELDEPLGVP